MKVFEFFLNAAAVILGYEGAIALIEKMFKKSKDSEA